MAKEGTTRYYSDLQEKSVCKALNAYQQSNSGAGKFSKGDCIHKGASLLIECKTCTTDKDSVSVKKEWLEKNLQEARSQRLANNCVAINFGPNQKNYYIIDENLMQFLVTELEKLYA